MVTAYFTFCNFLLFLGWVINGQPQRSWILTIESKPPSHDHHQWGVDYQKMCLHCKQFLIVGENRSKGNTVKHFPNVHYASCNYFDGLWICFYYYVGVMSMFDTITDGFLIDYKWWGGRGSKLISRFVRVLKSPIS